MKISNTGLYKWTNLFDELSNVIYHILFCYSAVVTQKEVHYYFSLGLYFQELNLLGIESVSYAPVKGFYILWGSWVPYKKLLSCCATYIDMIDLILIFQQI